MNYKYDLYEVQFIVTNGIDDFIKNINQCKTSTDYKKVALLYKGNNDSGIREICDIILFNKSIIKKIYIIVCNIEHINLFIERSVKKYNK